MAPCQARVLTSSCTLLAIRTRDSWPCSSRRTVYTWGLCSYGIMDYYIYTLDYTGVVFIFFCRSFTRCRFALTVFSSCTRPHTCRS